MINHSKIIISDLDGTLVYGERRMSLDVIGAIEEWNGMGNKFTIATGRALTIDLTQIINRLRIDVPVIINGGAELYDPLQNKVLSSKYLSESKSKRIVEHLLKHQIEFLFVRNNTIYTLTNSALLNKRIKTKKITASTPLDNVSKIRVFGNLPSHLLSLARELEVNASKSNNNGDGHDITATNVNKRFFLSKLLHIAKIDERCSIGIGDDVNDIPLLLGCNTKITFSNAPIQLRKVANVIIGDDRQESLIRQMRLLTNKQLSL